MAEGKVKTLAKPRSLAARGVALLSRREYSRKQLRERLAEGGDSPEALEETLDLLEQKGYLNDERFAESLCRAKGSRYGNFRLQMQLREAGVAGEIISRVLGEATDEVERAKEVWSRRFGSLAEDEKEKARQVRFLANRGFSFDTIQRVLSRVREELSSR